MWGSSSHKDFWHLFLLWKWCKESRIELKRVKERTHETESSKFGFSRMFQKMSKIKCSKKVPKVSQEKGELRLNGWRKGHTRLKAANLDLSFRMKVQMATNVFAVKNKWFFLFFLVYSEGKSFYYRKECIIFSEKNFIPACW